MYIKSMVIDGFKTYGKITEINGFDCEFNAITGLNGSGKSNILDAICFVLGVTDLTQVRAASLEELVYKSGQAGITKASVTITFDNRDTNKSPLGYESYEEITITRQAVVAGEDRYMINGSTVQNKCVNGLFHSVYLNVNNPHFLIMQGRITKVLNMEPPEILSLIEEAAGTRMFETKKQVVQRIIEKKDEKLVQLSELINEEIEPKLTKLKDERNQYLELQKISREVEHLSKILVAWQYTSEEAKCKKAEEMLEELNNNIKELREKIAKGRHEEKDIESHIEVLQKERDECGSVVADLERKLTEAEKHEAKLSAKVKSNEDGINSEGKNIKHLEKVDKDDQNNALKLITGAVKTTPMAGAALQLYTENPSTSREVKQGASSTIKPLQNMRDIQKTTLKELQVEEQKEVISIKNKEIQDAMHRKRVLLKELANSELQCTSLQHNVSKCQADAKESRSKLIDMEKSHTWILENRPYFGQPNGIYDFKATDPKEAGTRIAKLQDLKAKLSSTVNTRAMNILEKEEERYNAMMEMRQIVMSEKEAIIAVIEEFEKKKKEALQLAWEQVNKEFGSIFGSLLHGAQAKLKPPDGKDIFDGLEVKVGFNGLWKDSLQELSDGQRSLVALSLILAILLFKPAPIYILDEVDAALDLSHTQNIGQMLKTHFKHSQFIVVSMKDGMLNNANVLFRTKFVDGMSTVTRTTPG